MQREQQIKDETTKYLDTMPTMSKVAYDDLVSYVCTATGYFSPFVVRHWVRDVVRARKDFMVLRGKGICKYSRP